MSQIDLLPTPLIRGGMPLYRQLANVIRALASEGGGLAFTEAQLCRRFVVSRTTVRQALQRLEGDGLLVRLQGKGTTVIPRKAGERLPLWVFGSIEDIIAYGHETAYSLLEHGVVPALNDVVEALDMPAGAPCYRFLGVRAAKGLPFALIETWLPHQIGVQVLPHLSGGFSPITALSEERIGVRADSVEQTFSAGLASEEVAGHIGVQPGKSVLVIRRLYSDNAGLRIGFSVNYCNSERFQYRTRLQRRPNAKADD